MQPSLEKGSYRRTIYARLIEAITSLKYDSREAQRDRLAQPVELHGLSQSINI